MDGYERLKEAIQTIDQELNKYGDYTLNPLPVYAALYADHSNNLAWHADRGGPGDSGYDLEAEIVGLLKDIIVRQVMTDNAYYEDFETGTERGEWCKYQADGPEDGQTD